MIPLYPLKAAGFPSCAIAGQQQLAHHLSHHCLWALLHQLLDLQTERERHTQTDKGMWLVGLTAEAKSPSFPCMQPVTTVRVGSP